MTIMSLNTVSTSQKIFEAWSWWRLCLQIQFLLHRKYL